MKYKTPSPAIIVGIIDTKSSLFEKDSVVEADAIHTEESTGLHWLDATSADNEEVTNLESVPDEFEAGHWRHTHGGFASAVSDEKRCSGFKPSISSATPGSNPLKSDPISDIAAGKAAALDDILLM